MPPIEAESRRHTGSPGGPKFPDQHLLQALHDLIAALLRNLAVEVILVRSGCSCGRCLDAYAAALR